MHELNGKEKDIFIRYGSAAAEAMFDFPCNFFQIPNCEGIIAYRIEYHCAVVFGDPICPLDEIPLLTTAFHDFCSQSNWNVIYVIVTEKFAKWVKSQYCNILMEVCEEFIFNPEIDPCATSNRLKHRVEKSVKHGLTVHEYIPFDREIEKTLNEIGMLWQKKIKGPNLYLGHLNFFEDHKGKRWFYTKDGEKLTGMIMLSRLEAYEGWLLKFLVTAPDAFHDTSEFLMISVMDKLRKENCRFLTKGMLPLHRMGEVSGLNQLTVFFVQNIYKLISGFFKFKKRKEYWLRYHPKVAPAYLVLAHSRIGLNETRALSKIFKSNIHLIK